MDLDIRVEIWGNERLPNAAHECYARPMTRNALRANLPFAVAGWFLCLCATTPGWAQNAQPPSPPPGYPPPPPGYMYVPTAAAAPASPPQPQALPPPQQAAPQPAYPPPPPGYAYVPVTPTVPVGYQSSPELPYTEGEPIPLGYRLKEEPRWGLVTGGWILTGVAWGLSGMVALTADFKNSSGYLLVPFVGPWLTMNRRDYGNCSDDPSVHEGLRCTADVFVVMGLITDGLLQAGGGALLLSGYLAQRKILVRNNVALGIRPRVSSTGFALTATGTF
jgi:hypothetical protein